MQIQNCLQLSQNCQGTPYQYSEMTVSNSWIGQFTYNMVTYNVNVSHTEAYWDWRFLGYEKQGSVDYTKNCHGFAFGVGDWPADGGMGAIIILKEGACYAQTDPVHATIAVSTGCTHSIKVSGGLALNGSQPWPRVLATTEKFRESAIYKQHNSNGVTVINPINAHGLGASLGGLYKKL